MLVVALLIATGMTISLAVGTLAPLIVTIAAVWAPALDTRSIPVGLSKAVLIIGGYGGALMLLGPLTGVPVTTTLAGGSVAALLALVLAHRWQVGAARSRWLASLGWGAVAGPSLLLGAVVVSALRYGGLAAWAMNGDARNHSLATQAIDLDGGWMGPFAYPAYANAISAWLGSGPADETYYTQIQHQALLFLVMLSAFSLLCGMAASQGSRPFREIRGAGGSLAAMSPLVLGVLHEGFFPVPWAWLVAASVAIIALVPGIRWPEVVLYSGLGVGIVFATFPPVAPVVGLVALGARIGFVRDTWVVVLTPILALVAMASILRLLGANDGVVATLVQPGAALRYSIALPLAMVLVGVLNWLGGQPRDQRPALMALVLGAAGLILIVGWLDALAPSPGMTYYAAKAMLVGTCALIPLALYSSPTPSTRTGWRRDTALLVALAASLAITYLPVLFSSSPRMPIAKIAQGWFMPTVEEGSLVMEVLSEDTSALEWRMYEEEVDRRLNIWLAAGGDNGALDVLSLRYTWPYAADMTAVEGFCQRLGDDRSLDLFVDTSAQKEYLRAACAVDSSRLHVVGKP